MEYLLMLYSEENGWLKMPKAQQEQAMGAYMAFTEALKKAAVLKGSNRLGLSSTATTVRVANGKSQVLNALVGGALPRRKSRDRRGASSLGRGHGGVSCSE